MQQPFQVEPQLMALNVKLNVQDLKNYGNAPSQHRLQKLQMLLRPQRLETVQSP
jgi:hypothetical protein